MKLTKLFREYQSLIISIVVLITSGLGILFGVVPLGRKMIDMNTQLNGLLGEVDVLKNKVSVLGSIDEISMKSKVQTLISAVPSDKSLSTVFSTLDGLSAKTGVATGDFSLAKLGSLATESANRLTADEQTIGGNILPFSINISGTLDQLRAFMATSVSVRRLLRIRTFEVSFPKTVSESTGSGIIVSANLSMDTFYAPLPATIGSVSQPVTALTSEDEGVIAKAERMQIFGTTTAPLPPPSRGPAKPDPFSL